MTEILKRIRAVGNQRAMMAFVMCTIVGTRVVILAEALWFA